MVGLEGDAWNTQEKADMLAKIHLIKKSLNNGIKHRDKEQMDAFDCSGWIHITIMDRGDDALIKFKHENKHKFVLAKVELSPTQLWDQILKRPEYEDDLLPFLRKSSYRNWHQSSSKKWTRNANELKSAKILLEEASKTNTNYSSVEVISIPKEEGFTALAFCLPGSLCKWGPQICEISLDSTFQINALNFKVYALLGEVTGSGCPLGYLLIQSSNNILLRRPKFYNVKEARTELNFIDEDFVPREQELYPSRTQYEVLQKTNPQLTVPFQGVQQDRAPEPPKRSGCCIL
ncbi:hypothetical protein B0H34DRAFT_678046 [Crassisporium funariophilum]|nr:hypothetical protein B0H34DRAFT_678046 [Crassisporium funariophilum]